eukprot:CAMPEP_0196821740 /NCGR_PEP_ID=MMETSP1362-20130617/80696_1 /TAXON_ID=163516 /ORGANISM="Leptocylindrus danicus, Strain CCMP1856" /LENGTH=611 /DNA_ID=CAMNT_0042201059 /DNA_START=71 /DNA_END=1906 /DNA_ORIENTATION=+
MTLNQQTSPAMKPLITRVRDPDGFIGTIMYVGPVASAKNASEIYAGVAWDDATRGKHDGSVLCRATNKIVRHFSYPSFSRGIRSMGGLQMRSSSSPEFGGNKGCSFMRPSKLDFGVPLDDALLRSKYVEEDDPHLEAPNNIITGATVRTSSGRSKPIELLGELKIRKKQQLGKLKEISLRNLGVSSILQHSFGHLRGIDLSGNLLHDWKEVAALLDSFPCLEELCLSSNLLRNITNDTFASVSAPSFENDWAKLDGIIGTEFQPKKQSYDMLKRLVLNNCGLSSFRTLQILDHFFPNLDDICAVSNDFSNLNAVSSLIGSQEDIEEVVPIKGFDRLVTLDLSDCCISSWAHVERFRALPCLQSLSLNDNAIASIGRHDVNNNEDRYFESLKSIDLVGNQVSLWKDITNINALPVTSLRFRNNPVTSTLGASESRNSLIAILYNLNFLNSSPISVKERIEAERRYIRIVARELLLVESGDDAQERREYILNLNPRFDELKEKHKDSMLGVNSNLTQGGRLANDTMNITIVSMAPSSCTKGPLRKRLPSSLTVGRLKSMCSRAFDLDYATIILHFREANVKDSLPTLLDDEEHSLSYFGVSDGCEILVNEGER